MDDKDLSSTLDFKTYGDSLLTNISNASIAKSKKGDFSSWREDLWKTRMSIRNMTDYRDSKSIKLSSLFERKAQLIHCIFCSKQLYCYGLSIFRLFF